MNILFLHRGFPSQFRALAGYYGASDKHQCTFLSEHCGALPGVRHLVWSTGQGFHDEHAGPYLGEWERQVRTGRLVADITRRMCRHGDRPDVVVAHKGWGLPLFIKDVLPDTPLLTYQELFFEPEFDWTRPSDWRVTVPRERRIRRTRSSPFLAGLTWSDWCLTPTWWQHRSIPQIFRPKVSVLHEGINTEHISPRGTAPPLPARLPDGTVLNKGEELVTYFCRDLEPVRGIHHALPAFERLLRERPRCHVLMVGGDKVNYSTPLADGRSYREHYSRGRHLDPARFHHVTQLEYRDYLAFLRLSSAHLYLTTPYVLSWSLLEAMAAECLVVGSATPPVQEVIEHGVNGLLADFHDPEDIASHLVDALERQQDYEPLRKNARRTVLERYSVRRNLPLQVRLIEELADGKKPPPSAQQILQANPPVPLPTPVDGPAPTPETENV